MATVQIEYWHQKHELSSCNAALYIGIFPARIMCQLDCLCAMNFMPHGCAAAEAVYALRRHRTSSCSQGHVLVQDAAMREHRERLASAKQKARQLVQHQDVVLTERVDQVERLFQYQYRPTEGRAPACWRHTSTPACMLSCTSGQCIPHGCCKTLQPRKNGYSAEGAVMCQQCTRNCPAQGVHMQNWPLC